MDERNGTIRLVEPAHDFGTRGLTATVSRTDVEQAMRSEDGPVDLLLDVERATSDGRETQRIALGWEPQDLERLLETTNDDEISLTFAPEGQPRLDRHMLAAKAEELDRTIRKLTEMRDGLRHAALED